MNIINKKKLYIIFYNILILGLISSCSKPEQDFIEDETSKPDEVYISLSTSSINADSDGGDFDVEVESNVNYEVVISESSKEWIHEENKQENKHTFFIDKSLEYDNREGLIIFKSKELSDTIKVNQEGSSILSLNEKEYQISEDGGEISVDLKCNFDFGVKMPEVEWISKIETRALSNHTIRFSIAPNETFEDRMAEVIFYDKTNNNITDTIFITQRSEARLNISMSNPGSLQGELNKLNINHLKIKKLFIEGPINGSDIRVIREMAGVDYIEKETDGILEYLDLSNANIVEGGDFYCFPENIYNHECYSENNVIGRFMFRKCKSLKEVYLPVSCIYIHDYAFEYCENLTYIKLYDNITSIGEWCFNTCTSLNNIILPKSIKGIGEGAFHICSSLEYIKLPEGITRLNRATFFNCPSLKNIDLPESLHFVDNSVFDYCTSLKSIRFPDNVEQIYGCLGECTSIEKVYLGKKLIEAKCFDYRSCVNVKEIHIKAQNPPKVGFANIYYENATLYVPIGCYEKYHIAQNWRNFKNIVEE